MEDRQLETYFTSIKEDFNHVEDRFKAVDERFDAMDKRFDSVDQRLNGIQQGVNTMLELMGHYDKEQKDVKATLWEHDRRLVKLEQR